MSVIRLLMTVMAIMLIMMATIRPWNIHMEMNKP